MTDNLRPIDPEELLAHSGWMRALARGLVSDEATAEDLVQQVYAVALERPPRDRQALPAWLMRVLRNLAARSFRDNARRAEREERVARPESEDSPLGGDSPFGDLLERAELQRALMAAVLELEEPFRTTVLLRYFEERSPEEVARRLGVPVATVGTRLHRALEKLRTRLDREQGGRAAWVALLLPWIGLSTTAGMATGAASASGSGGATGALAPAAGAALGATTGSTLVATGTQALFGGIVIMQKTFVVSVLTGALCSAVGFGIGRTSAPEAKPAEGERIIAEAEYTELVEESAAAREQSTAMRAQNDALLREKEELAGRASKLEIDLAAATRALAEVASTDAEFKNASTLAVSFGEWGDLPAIRDANWPELAGAVTAINDLVKPLVDDLEQGKPISSAAQTKVAEENNKLVRFAVGLMEKLPSNAPMPVNGEFTHPISLINLIAAMLESAGVPLSDPQRSQISAIGSRYDSDFAQLQSQYAESTWELTKILDELSLKRDTMLEVEERLTAPQREVVMIPRIQNRVRLDTLSPVNMVIMNIGAFVVASPEAVRTRLVEAMNSNLGISLEDLEANDDLLVRYLQDVAEILTPVAPETAEFVHLDDVIIAGRAQERFLADLASRVSFDEAMTETLLTLSNWAVPQIALAAEPTNP